MPAQGIDPHIQLLSFTSPSACYDDHDNDKIAKHTEVLKEFQRIQLSRWLDQRRDEPVLAVYQSDGTPLRTHVRHIFHLNDLHVVREGKETREYLLQRLFMADAQGSTISVVVEPRLMKDKTHLTHMQAYCEQTQDPRLRGHEGISITHHTYDRAVFTAMRRRLLQRQVAMDNYLIDQDEDTGVPWSLKTWTLVTACCAHDVHNALKWAVLQYFSDKSVMRDTWCVHASLRNGFQQLVTRMRAWIDEHVSWEDGYDTDQLEIFALLGVEEKWLPVFKKLRPRFLDGRLKIAPECADDEYALAQLRGCLFYLWRFRSWAETRWISTGPSCKHMMLSLITGLHSVVDFILKEKAENPTWLKGFKRLTGQVKRMMAVTATTCHVSESVLAFVLEDDRVALNLDKIDALIMQGIEKVKETPNTLVIAVGQVAELSMTEMRDDMTQSALTQVAYMRMNLREARVLPWTVCRGDVRANLLALQAGPRPAEPTSQKIYDLLHMGASLDEVEKGVGLLAQEPWATKSVEDGHSAASTIMRMHKKLSREVMQARSYVRLAAVLFRKNIHEIKLDNAIKKLNTLRRKNVAKISGKHAYCSQLHTQMMESYGNEGKRVRKKISKTVIKNHGKAYNKLSAHRKQQLEIDASHMREDRSQLKAEKIEACKRVIQGLRAKRSEQLVKGSSLTTMDKCRFSEALIADYDEFFRAEQWTKSYVQELRESSLKQLTQLNRAKVATLDLMTVTLPGPASTGPLWLPWVTYNRTFFRSTIFRIRRGAVISHYKFAFAKQGTSQIVGLFPAEKLDIAEPHYEPGQIHEEQDLSDWEHNFDIDWETTVFSDEGVLDNADEVGFYCDVLMRSHGYFGTDSDWVGINTLALTLPFPANGERQTQAEEAGQHDIVDLEAWMEDPDAWDIMCGGDDPMPEMPIPERGSDNESEEENGEGENEEATGDEDGDIAMESLWDRRAELIREHDPNEDAFTWDLRGGDWTLAEFGVPYDYFRARARTPVAKLFCDTYGIRKTISFKISVYDEETCINLCKMWLHRVSHFFYIWAAHGFRDSFTFTNFHVAAYATPQEYEDLLLGANRDLRRRLAQIKAVKPRISRVRV